MNFIRRLMLNYSLKKRLFIELIHKMLTKKALSISAIMKRKDTILVL